MKIFLVFISLFYLFQLNAAEKNFLKCLGKEELEYHQKKISGAYLNLNKHMISEFIQMSSTLDIKDPIQQQICEAKDFSVSLSLLYYILKLQEKAFILKSDKEDITERSKDKKTIQEVIKRSLFALISFIDDLQMHATIPNCYVNSIPELKNLYIKGRYILEDVGAKNLLNEISDIKSVLKQLIDKNLSQKCKRNPKV